MTRIGTLFIAILFVQAVVAQQSIPSADEVLKTAYARAAKENKKVFVMFHASWCGWCHKMDTSMSDASVKSFFDKNFVITHLTILESPSKKHLENPGAIELYRKHAGENQGIPFWLVYDMNGKLLADSQIKPGENSGCPATKPEVDHFLKVLRQTTSISPEQAAAVETRFRKNDVSQ